MKDLITNDQTKKTDEKRMRNGYMTWKRGQQFSEKRSLSLQKDYQLIAQIMN